MDRSIEQLLGAIGRLASDGDDGMNVGPSSHLYGVHADSTGTVIDDKRDTLRGWSSRLRKTKSVIGIQFNSGRQGS